MLWLSHPGEADPHHPAILQESYGARRIYAGLWATSERHGRNRTARLMRQAGLIGGESSRRTAM